MKAWSVRRENATSRNLPMQGAARGTAWATLHQDDGAVVQRKRASLTGHVGLGMDYDGHSAHREAGATMWGIALLVGLGVLLAIGLVIDILDGGPPDLP